MPEKPFGHSCRVEYRPYGHEKTETREIRRRGTKSRVEFAARQMNGYRRHYDVTAYTRDQWIAAFGNGTETGRYFIA